MTQGVLVALAKWILESIGGFLYSLIRDKLDKDDRDKAVNRDVNRIERIRKDIQSAKQNKQPVPAEKREELKQAQRILAANYANYQLPNRK